LQTKPSRIFAKAAAQTYELSNATMRR